MRKLTNHYHFTHRGKNILCAVDYENDLKQYDITIWCDNRIIGREKSSSINRTDLSRMVKERFIPTMRKSENKTSLVTQ